MTPGVVRLLPEGRSESSGFSGVPAAPAQVPPTTLQELRPLASVTERRVESIVQGFGLLKIVRSCNLDDSFTLFG